MVNVSHDYYYGRSFDCFGIVVVVGVVKQFFFVGDDNFLFGRDAEFRRDERRGVEVNDLVLSRHRAHEHELFDDFRSGLFDHLGEFFNGHRIGKRDVRKRHCLLLSSSLVRRLLCVLFPGPRRTFLRVSIVGIVTRMIVVREKIVNAQRYADHIAFFSVFNFAAAASGGVAFADGLLCLFLVFLAFIEKLACVVAARFLLGDRRIYSRDSRTSLAALAAEACTCALRRTSRSVANESLTSAFALISSGASRGRPGIVFSFYERALLCTLSVSVITLSVSAVLSGRRTAVPRTCICRRSAGVILCSGNINGASSRGRCGRFNFGTSGCSGICLSVSGSGSGLRSGARLLRSAFFGGVRFSLFIGSGSAAFFFFTVFNIGFFFCCLTVCSILLFRSRGALRVCGSVCFYFF